MRYATLTAYPERVRFCLRAPGARQSGEWDTSTAQGRRDFEEFRAMLIRTGFRVVEHEASPHAILREMTA